MSDANQTALRSKVMEAAREMTRVPLLPDYAQRVLEMCRLPYDAIDVAELSQLVGKDSALAARALKAANSPFYGAVSPITTIRQAIVTIGLRDFVGLVMAATLMGRLPSAGGSASFPLAEFWVHALAVSSAARAVALLGGSGMLSPAEIGLAGLLHDIGKNVFCLRFPEAFDGCLRRVEDDAHCYLEEAERDAFGIDHAELGGLLAEQWQLPAFIVQTARWHHEPSRADAAFARCVPAVACANSFVQKEKIGRSGNRWRDLSAEGQSQSCRDLMDHLARSREQVLDEIGKTLQVTLSTFEHAEATSPAAEEQPRRAGLEERAGSAAGPAVKTRPAWLSRIRRLFGR